MCCSKSDCELWPSCGAYRVGAGGGCSYADYPPHTSHPQGFKPDSIMTYFKTSWWLLHIPSVVLSPFTTADGGSREWRHHVLINLQSAPPAPRWCFPENKGTKSQQQTDGYLRTSGDCDDGTARTVARQEMCWSEETRSRDRQTDRGGGESDLSFPQIGGAVWEKEKTAVKWDFQ